MVSFLHLSIPKNVFLPFEVFSFGCCCQLGVFFFEKDMVTHKWFHLNLEHI